MGKNLKENIYAYMRAHTDMGSPGGAVIKNLPANARDTSDMGLIPEWEDPVELQVVTHPSILAWRISWTEEPGGLQSRSCKELDMT